MFILLCMNMYVQFCTHMCIMIVNMCLHAYIHGICANIYPGAARPYLSRADVVPSRLYKFNVYFTFTVRSQKLSMDACFFQVAAHLVCNVAEAFINTYLFCKILSN